MLDLNNVKYTHRRYAHCLKIGLLIQRNSRSNNPVAAALLGLMDYPEKEKIAIRIEFARMLTNMQLDQARSALLTAFIETYVKLTEEEEILYRDRLKQELTQQEAEKLMEITTSYHEKGREQGKMEGKLEGKLEGKAEVAKKMLAKKISIDEIVELTELTREQVEKLKKQAPASRTP
jgi:predicted transposase/invertase (TIGR01784 family)